MVGTSGISGERFDVLTPSAFKRPDFMCGIAIGVPTKLTLMIPDIRSCCAGPLPLYGTWLSLIPAMYMKSSVTRCCAPPLPELAKSVCALYGMLLYTCGAITNGDAVRSNV